VTQLCHSRWHDWWTRVTWWPVVPSAVARLSRSSPRGTTSTVVHASATLVTSGRLTRLLDKSRQMDWRDSKWSDLKKCFTGFISKIIIKKVKIEKKIASAAEPRDDAAPTGPRGGVVWSCGTWPTRTTGRRRRYCSACGIGGMHLICARLLVGIWTNRMSVLAHIKCFSFAGTLVSHLIILTLTLWENICWNFP
jgi:hypothetical protein